MRAALLCPGPSLAQYPGREGYEIVIGVNRVAGRITCDYACMLDVTPYELLRRDGLDFVGDPVHTTPARARAKVLRKWPDAERFAHMDLQAIDSVPTSLRWRLYSVTCGLVLAHHLGAESVDCWGIDWHGELDWDGLADARFVRTDERWRQESVVFANVAAVLGVPVTRMQEAGNVK